MNKKIIAVVGCGLIAGASFLGAGCTDYKTQLEQAEEDKNAMDEKISALEDAQVSLGKTMSDQNEANAQAVADLKLEIDEKDAQILEDANTIAEAEGVIEELKVEVTVQDEAVAVENAEADGEEIDLDFNTALPVSKLVLDDSDVEGLFDGRIEFDNNDYDVKETLEFTTDFKLQTSIEGDEEFKDAPYLVTEAREALKYLYTFEDVIDPTDISENTPLKINLLGKQLDIVDADSADESITIRTGTKVLMSEGAETTVVLENGDEAKITCVYIGSNGAKFSIDGQLTSVLDTGDTDKAGGKEISVVEILENEANEVNGDDQVEFYIADDVFRTINNDEEYTEDEEDFIYEINFNGGDLESIGVFYDQKSDELDDDYQPIALGESITFPEGYINVKFKSVTQVDYNSYDVSLGEYGDNDVPVVEIRSDDDEGLVIVNDEIGRVYLNETTVFYRDADNDWVEAPIGDLTLDYGDVSLAVSYAGGILSLGDLDVVTDFVKFGATEEESESTEVVYDGVNVGGSDYKVLATDGVIITTPEDKDELEFEVPSEEMQGTIVIY